MAGISLANPGSLETVLAANSLNFDLGVREALRKQNSESTQSLTLEILRLPGWASCRIKKNRNPSSDTLCNQFAGFPSALWLFLLNWFQQYRSFPGWSKDSEQEKSLDPEDKNTPRGNQESRENMKSKKVGGGGGALCNADIGARHGCVNLEISAVVIKCTRSVPDWADQHQPWQEGGARGVPSVLEGLYTGKET